MTLYDYGSTQFDLPVRLAELVRALGREIDPDDLAPDGREGAPHVTVRYGLTGTDTEVITALRALVGSFRPIHIHLGKTSLFAATDPSGVDVLKIDVSGPRLHDLNREIAAHVQTVTTHPVYSPHCTVAYLRAGRGQKYVGRTDLAGLGCVCTHLVLSDQNGTRHLLPLGRAPKESSMSLSDHLAKALSVSTPKPPTPGGAEASTPGTRHGYGAKGGRGYWTVDGMGRVVWRYGMMPAHHRTQGESKAHVRDLVEKMNAGQLDPDDLSAEDRQRIIFDAKANRYLVRKDEKGAAE